MLHLLLNTNLQAFKVNTQSFLRNSRFNRCTHYRSAVTSDYMLVAKNGFSTQAGILVFVLFIVGFFLVFSIWAISRKIYSPQVLSGSQGTLSNPSGSSPLNQAPVVPGSASIPLSPFAQNGSPALIGNPQAASAKQPTSPFASSPQSSIPQVKVDIAQDQALRLVEQWLRMKPRIFAPPFDTSGMDSIVIASGPMFNDITKKGGSIDWLRSNSSHYNFTELKVLSLKSFDRFHKKFGKYVITAMESK